jgi:membrane protein YdbS with pleckstrin-like domain
MNNIQGAIFIILIIVIIIGIIAIKFMYDLWATSVTINLLKNNSGLLSGKRVIIWLAIIGIIALILGFLGKRQRDSQY